MLKNYTYLVALWGVLFSANSFGDTLSVTEVDTLVEDEKKIEVYSIEGDTIEENLSNIENGSVSCTPPCRKGYICVDGQCVSACNPPCPPGYVCDSELNDCVPDVSREETPPSRFHDENVYNGIRIDGSLKSAQDIKTVSSVYFNLTNVFYGIGTGYSAIVPLIMKEIMKNNYYDDYYDDFYDYYNDGYYNWDAIMSIAPQTGMFVAAGAFNQGARNRQRRYLRALGEEPNGGLTAVSWILYAASIHTANWNIFAQTNDGSDNLRTSSGIVNLIALFSSYIVSNVSFHKNKADLEKAVNKNKKLAAALEIDKKSISVYPYYSYDNKSKTNRVGLGLNF